MIKRVLSDIFVFFQHKDTIIDMETWTADWGDGSRNTRGVRGK